MNRTVYNVFLVIAILVSLALSALVFLTGKGDAMSGGGGSVRTTYKGGKASFDDRIALVVASLGGAFMVLMLILDRMATGLE